MKRSIYDREVESMDMANCLMLLSRVGEMETQNQNQNRMFACKTCNRQFTSFQALGGHRASHKKLKLEGGDQLLQISSTGKPKTHECSICGLEFAIGQALGGHMRRHRAAIISGEGEAHPIPKSVSHSQVPVLKKQSSGKRVFCLDLNLTPMENDLIKFQFIRSSPMVDCFL